MDAEHELSPYDLGWSQGYDDLMSDCPYAEGTKEHEEFWEGYSQGCMDC